MTREHPFQADHWQRRRRNLAAAIGGGDDILRQQRAQRLHVAGAGGNKEGAGDLRALFLRHRKTRPGCMDMISRTASRSVASQRVQAS